MSADLQYYVRYAYKCYLLTKSVSYLLLQVAENISSVTCWHVYVNMKACMNSCVETP